MLDGVGTGVFRVEGIENILEVQSGDVFADIDGFILRQREVEVLIFLEWSNNGSMRSLRIEL